MSESIEAQVAVLMADRAIAEVLNRYCRALDRMDKPLAYSVWHPDGTADYGPMYAGTGPGFIDWVWDTHLNFDNHAHQLSNVVIEADPERGTAVSESSVSVWLRMPPKDGAVTDVFGRGRYVDRWSRRAGVWAIDHRIYVDDLQRIERTPVELTRREPTGTRDLDDPSYAVLPVGPVFGGPTG